MNIHYAFIHLFIFHVHQSWIERCPDDELTACCWTNEKVERKRQTRKTSEIKAIQAAFTRKQGISRQNGKRGLNGILSAP